MKCTSRHRRSSFATIIGALSCRAGGQSSRELRPAIERVGALACLDLAEGLGQVVALDLGEAGERGDAAPRGPRPERPCCAVETRV